MEVHQIMFAKKINMSTSQAIENIKKIILENQIAYTDIDEKKLEINYNCRLVELYMVKDDIRYQIAKDESVTWEHNNMLAWGSYLTLENVVSRWDITTDGTIVCYRYSYTDFYYYRLEWLNKNEVKKIKEEKKWKEEEKAKRMKIRDILTPVLIQDMYPYGKLKSGELETKYGVHLRQIQRGEHQCMKYKPRDRNEWMADKVLPWGSCTGWDITRDGKIACCRVNYDDYINFEIDILTQQEINEYKKKFSATDSTLINRLATLKEMLKQSLITEEEFNHKKKDILSQV